MNNNVEIWVNQWATETGDEIYRKINAQLNFFAKVLYHDYQPTAGQGPSFHARLENWLNNVANEDDRRTLFKILPHIFYIGMKELNALYSVAYNELIASWLIDIDNISFNDFGDTKDRLDIGIKNCWICPITDSFDINSFFNINNIPNNVWNERRPQWYGVDREGDNGPLWQSHLNYIEEHNIRKLVILEDFVGSGSQIEGVVNFLMSKGLDLDVLLLPLINCPVGVNTFTRLDEFYGRLTYKAVVEVSENCFIQNLHSANEHSDFMKIRELIQRVYEDTSGGIPEGNTAPYSPFGYRDTGGLIIKHSNSPDNTIPSIHWKSDTWVPIFPRHARN